MYGIASKAVALVCSIAVTRVAARTFNDPLLDTYDYIIVGGGASGLTVANRLTENPDINVLVLEAGPADEYEEHIQIPVFATSGVISRYNWNDETVPQTYMDGVARNLPQGLAVGGGTIINAMLWNRGDQGDYNDWVTLGNPGWGWDDLLPYFERSENFNPDFTPQQAQMHGLGNAAGVHGTTGPIENVAFPHWFYNVSDIYLQAMNAMDVPTVPDPATGYEKGAMFLPYDINANNQTRADARRSYYDPFAQRPNLYVSTGQRVTRVLFEGGCAAPGSDGARAVGVEYSPASGQPLQTVAASREVIMAAGAIRSPQVMELSGIGSSATLNGVGVTQRVNLPGVGNNLQDHLLIRVANQFNNQSFIYPNWLQNQTINATAERTYFANKTGPWCYGPDDADGFLALPQFSTRAADLQGTVNGQTADQYLAEGLDPTVVAGYNASKSLLADTLTDMHRAALEILQNQQGLFTGANMRPFTRGSVHITSTDGFGNPDIDFRYGSNPVDLEVIVDSLTFFQRLLQSPEMAVLEPELGPMLQSTNHDDLLNVVKQNGQTEFHPTGTLAMLPRDMGGVVDPNLLVYGTQNLRVVDASMQPIVAAGHLMGPVYAVAEKAADIITQANSAATPPHLPLDDTQCHAAGARKRSPSKLQKRSPAAINAPELYNVIVAGQYPDARWQSEGLPTSDLIPGLKKGASVGLPVGRALDGIGGLLGGILDGIGGVL